MMVEGGGRVGMGGESVGAGVGSLIVIIVVVIVLCPDRHPLPSPTTTAITPPHVTMCCPYVVVRCRLHLSSPHCCAPLLCELPPRCCCCWHSLCAVCCCCCCVRHALLLRCYVQPLLLLARGGGCGDTKLRQCSFFGRCGHTTATYPHHRYGFCMGLNLATRTCTHDVHYSHPPQVSQSPLFIILLTVVVSSVFLVSSMRRPVVS